MPKDVFSKKYSDLDSLIEYARSGTEKLIFEPPQFSTGEFHYLEHHIDALIFGVSRVGPSYLFGKGFDDAKVHINEIGSILAGCSKVPRELVVKLGYFFQMIESCGGCGKGIHELIRLDHVLRQIWDRREEISASCSDQNHFVRLSQIVSKLNHLTRLRGDKASALASAEFVRNEATSGHLGDKTSPARLELETRTRESLVGVVGFDELLDTVGEQYGEHSTQFLGVLQCSACQAVFSGDLRVQRFDLARERIMRAKEAISHAKSEISRTGLGDMAQIVSREKDLEFISVSYIERKYEQDAHRLDEELRRYGVDNLLKLREATLAPLRRAKVNYWIWRAEGRSKLHRLLEALDLVNLRSEVAKLCVLDVSGFRSEIEAEIAKLVAVDR